MKTRFALSAVVGLMLLMSGNILWAQGRGNGRGHHNNGNGGHGGNGNGNGRGHGQYHERNNDRSYHDSHHQTEYSYGGHHGHGHHDTKVVYVHHYPPVERVVVHHHHNTYYEPRYVYYRDYDVYYDTHRRVYITFSGRNWSISTEIPIRMHYVDRATVVSTHVDYYNDDFPVYLDSRRPGGRHCDDW
jgi:hypothetical protein